MIDGECERVNVCTRCKNENDIDFVQIILKEGVESLDLDELADACFAR